MNFKRYNESDNSWTDSHYIKKTDTDTITTLPAIIYPLAQTATLGLKGQTVQNGDSPVMPEGTGERTGNLLNADSYYASYKSGNSYTATTSQFNTAIISPFTTSDIGKTYTISCDITEISSTNVRWLATINGVSVNGDGRSSTGQIKLTFTVATANDSLKITYGSGNYTLTIANVMMNEGDNRLPYEPYGIKIPILCGNQTTNIYLGETQSTRAVKKLVLTGAESWAEGSANYYSRLPSKGRPYSNALCTHAKNASSVDNNGNYLYLQKSTFVFETLTDFKSYLAQQYAAGTPVTVWYVLATHGTGIVNEPLMKIGDYADEVSGVSIPTIAGANTIDIDTTLKPSEVSVNYKGWHPMSGVHERESGAWT